MDRDEDLLAAARAVRDHAHAPYSGFPVGAAILTPSGRIHVGCNVENASYPEGTCAEAGAIAAMVAAGETRIVAIAVIADAPVPVTPCGGCRQRIAEFAEPGTRVLMANIAGSVQEATIAELLPRAFARRHTEV